MPKSIAPYVQSHTWIQAIREKKSQYLLVWKKKRTQKCVVVNRLVSIPVDPTITLPISDDPRRTRDYPGGFFLLEFLNKILDNTKIIPFSSAIPSSYLFPRVKSDYHPSSELTHNHTKAVNQISTRILMKQLR
ncbi:hypothetical protein Drorol1_Dr00014161 [Drosera rotundifolia]